MRKYVPYCFLQAFTGERVESDTYGPFFRYIINETIIRNDALSTHEEVGGYNFLLAIAAIAQV